MQNEIKENDKIEAAQQMLKVKRGSVVRETEKINYCHEHCYTDGHIKLWVKKGRDNKLDK